eukprot:scaffold20692_cov97-Cylindrotheca_fusiformis.AAC.1
MELGSGGNECSILCSNTMDGVGMHGFTQAAEQVQTGPDHLLGWSQHARLHAMDGVGLHGSTYLHVICDLMQIM